MLWVLTAVYHAHSSQLHSFSCPHFWARCLMLVTVTYQYWFPVIEWLSACMKLYVRFYVFYVFSIPKNMTFNVFWVVAHVFSNTARLSIVRPKLVAYGGLGQWRRQGRAGGGWSPSPQTPGLGPWFCQYAMEFLGTKMSTNTHLLSAGVFFSSWKCTKTHFRPKWLQFYQ